MSQASSTFAAGGETLGAMSHGRIEKEAAMAAGAFWYDMHALKMSTEAGDVKFSGPDSKFPKEVVSAVVNAHATNAATLVCQSEANYRQGLTSLVTLSIPGGSSTGRIPPLHLIKKTGTSDDLVLFTHRR